MSCVNRFGSLLTLTIALAVIADSPAVFGQRITFGGRNKTSNESKENDQNGQNDQQNDGDNRSGPSQNDSDGKDVQQQLQQFFQGGQGNPRSRRNRNEQDEHSNNNQLQDGQQFDTLQHLQNQGNRQFQGNRHSSNRRRFTIDNWSIQFGNTNQPFSAKWYEQHPDAWHYDHKHSNAWVAVPSTGVTAWLGWGPGGATIVGPGARVVEHFDPNRYGDWLPLGVYLLMSSPEDQTRLVQLSVDRLGTLRGVYYDAITGASHNVSGKMYRDTQEARWSLRSNRQVKFRARLSDLLQPYGWVRVSLPGGDQRWELARLEQ